MRQVHFAIALLVISVIHAALCSCSTAGDRYPTYAPQEFRRHDFAYTSGSLLRNPQKIEARLDELISCNIADLRLIEAVDRIGTMIGIKISVDWLSLSESNILPQKHVMFNATASPARVVITQMLKSASNEDVDIGIVFSGAGIFVAPIRVLKEPVIRRRYELGHLTSSLPEWLADQYGDNALVELKTSYDISTATLVTLIRDTVAPDAWKEYGGQRNSLSEIGDSVIIMAPMDDHVQIELLLYHLEFTRQQVVFDFIKRYTVNDILRSANALRLEGKLDEAFHMVRRALAINPEDPIGLAIERLLLTSTRTK